jgi:hypothetical protein
MLRFLYQCVLRAHPPRFQERFADQMLSIFDETEGGLATAKLLADGILSLLRQWTLRPEFWKEPAIAATPNGVPLFQTFESNKPRTQALLFGAFLSILVLDAACWTMGYAWNHPSFVWIQQPVISPPESWKAKPSGHGTAMVPGDELLYTDQGRVVLVFRSHRHAAATSENNPTLPQSSVTGGGSTGGAIVDNQTLQSYAGTYIGQTDKDPTVSIAMREGQLQLEIAGQGTSALAPLSQTKFMAVAIPDCWVEFSTNGSGYAHGIHLYRSHSSTFLRRESSPLEF